MCDLGLKFLHVVCVVEQCWNFLQIHETRCNRNTFAVHKGKLNLFIFWTQMKQHWQKCVLEPWFGFQFPFVLWIFFERGKHLRHHLFKVICCSHLLQVRNCNNKSINKTEALVVMQKLQQQSSRIFIAVSRCFHKWKKYVQLMFIQGWCFRTQVLHLGE